MLFSRPRPRIGSSRSRFRPTLESLDERFCPASMSLEAAVVEGNTVMLSGQVTAENPADLTVYFNGLYEGWTSTNYDGSFGILVQVPSSGTIGGSVEDSAGLGTDDANVDLGPPPEITLSTTPQDHRNVLLSGQVTDANPGGLTVYFSGAYSGSVVTDPDGTYSLTVEASHLGAVFAAVSNTAGLTSNVAEAQVTSQAPVVFNFYAVREVNNLFTFHGQVDDDSAAGLTITFSGFASLEGQTVTVGEDGSFQFCWTLDSTDIGLVSAQVTDWWDQLSNTAQTYVDAS